jgi:DNA modification methylase
VDDARGDVSPGDVLNGDEPFTIMVGDVLDRLRALPDGCVQTAITSPPYWALRDYGLPPTVWNADPECGHTWTEAGSTMVGNDPSVKSTLQYGTGPNPGDKYSSDTPQRTEASRGAFCTECGAWRGCLGLEPTPDLYVAHIVEVFREVWRVLRPDGTAWLNLGDSYASGGPQTTGRNDVDRETPGGRGGSFRGGTRTVIPDNGQGQSGIFGGDHKYNGVRGRGGMAEGLKPKDMVGIPWRVAFALQADGWWLRSDIVWSKPNPMPESITDRPTKAHEYLFLLARGQRYFYDHDAVRERASAVSLARIAQTGFEDQNGGVKDYANGVNPNRSARKALENFALNPGRNLRDVWHIATQPYEEAHFATYPPKLIEPCVKAGTSEYGRCATCSAPFERVLEQVNPDAKTTGRHYDQAEVNEGRGVLTGGSVGGNRLTSGNLTNDELGVWQTIGWKRTCNHEGEPMPSVVLDMFAGSGTTGAVALRNGRRFIGIDLNPEYAELARQRIRSQGQGIKRLVDRATGEVVGEQPVLF